MNKAHKKGVMRKHQVTKNPRRQNKNNISSESKSTISKNPSQIQSTNIKHEQNQPIKSSVSNNQIDVVPILTFKTNPKISKTNLIFPASEKTIYYHIGNNEYSSQLQVMFRKIFGLNETNVSTGMILTSEQKNNLIDFISQELYQCNYHNISLLMLI